MSEKLLSRREFLRLGALTSAGLMLAACQVAAPAAPEEPAEEEAVEEEPAEEEAPVEIPPSGKKYEGITLSVAGMSWVWEGAEAIYGEYLEETGMELSVAEYGQQEITDKLMQSVAAGVYLADFIGIESNVTCDVWGQGLCLPVPDYVLDDPSMAWDDVLPVYADKILTWQGTVYGLPFDGDTHNLFFLFPYLDDADNQANFQSKYGYDLDPDRGPKTWREHRDYAEFFTGWDWAGDGTPDVGFAHMMKRGDTGFWGFISRCAAYAKHPDDPGFYFDLDTGEPRINNPAFVRGLEEWKDELQFTLPSGVNTGWGDCLEALKQLRSLMMIGWPGPVLEGEDSQAQGICSFSVIPGSEEVYNASSGEWETPSEINIAPYLSFGGWCFSVAKGTENPEAAFDFGMFLCNQENGNLMAYKSYTNAVRYSALESITPWVEVGNMSERSATTYLRAMEETLLHPNLVLNFRLPGWVQYRDALELAVSKGMTGEDSPQNALDEAAATWKEVTDRLGGPAKQMDFYRSHLGL